MFVKQLKGFVNTSTSHIRNAPKTSKNYNMIKCLGYYRDYINHCGSSQFWKDHGIDKPLSYSHPSGQMDTERAIHSRHGLKLYQNNEQTSFSTVFPQNTLLFSGTTKKSHNFKMPLLSCHVKKPCSIICCALAFCWHPTPTKNGQLQGAPSEML